jgi:hypothetical protein
VHSPFNLFVIVLEQLFLTLDSKVWDLSDVLRTMETVSNIDILGLALLVTICPVEGTPSSSLISLQRSCSPIRFRRTPQCFQIYRIYGGSRQRHAFGR